MADRVSIQNPFVDIEGYRCFGCDPNSSIGLRLSFEREGDILRARWQPDERMEGYPGVVHGGIQATLADEIGGWFIYAIAGTAGVTRTLEMSYEQSAQLSDGPFTIEAREESRTRKELTVLVRITNNAGELLATGRCVYAVFSEQVARKRLHFPGAEAFYAE
jgi:uncharacterized protein (TIGR00369 family)